MAAKHTLGPWEARASHGSDDFGIIAPDANAEGGWVCVAECFSDIRRANEQALQEAAANALRIVQCVNAHDDLLDALQEAADRIDGIKGGSVSETVALMRAALANAGAAA